MLKYIVIAIGAFALGAGVVYDAYNAKYKNLQKEYSLLNDRAKFEYERQNKVMEGIKKEYDEKYNDDIASLNSVIDRMRIERSEAMYHLESKLASVANQLNRVSIERDELLSAIQQFDGEVSQQIAQCDNGRIVLNSIKMWAEEVYSEK